MSQPSSSGRTWSGVAAVESQTTRAGWAAAASKSGIVRNGFDGASSQTRSTPSGGGPVWSNSTLSIAPARELVEHRAGSVVGALGERDGLSGREQREDDATCTRPCPEAKRSASPPSSRPSCRSASASVGLEKREYVNGPGSPSSYGHVVERSIGVVAHGGEAITGLRERR